MRRLDTRDALEFVDATGAGSCPVDRAEMLASRSVSRGTTPEGSRGLDD